MSSHLVVLIEKFAPSNLDPIPTFAFIFDSFLSNKKIWILVFFFFFYIKRNLICEKLYLFILNENYHILNNQFS